MGGIIAKTMVTAPGYQLWDTIFNQRPAQLLTDSDDQKIADIFIFSPKFTNNRVFFIDTPHRGSETADSLLGKIGAALVTLPESFLGVFRRFVNRVGIARVTPEMRPLMADYGPNSVEVMRPGHPLVEKLNSLTIKAKAYSVIGSQNKINCQSRADCVDVTDGVVPYSSAHNEQALAEILVRSEHDSYQNQEAINFILNKLRQH